MRAHPLPSAVSWDPWGQDHEDHCNEPFEKLGTAGPRTLVPRDLWPRLRAGQTVVAAGAEGLPREVTVIYSPMPGDADAVAGVMLTVVPTDGDGNTLVRRRRVEERDRFLLALDDATRPLADPEAVVEVHARMLGEHLGAERCAYADVAADGVTFEVLGDYNRGVESIVGRYSLFDFGQEYARRMTADEPYVIEDIDESNLPAVELESYRRTQIRAVICVALHKRGRLAAMMAVHQTTPRRWTDGEMALVRRVAGRCWESMERIRAEAQLRQLADAMPQIVFAAGPDGHVDYFNRRWYEYTGIPEGEVGFESWKHVHTADGLARVMEVWPDCLAQGKAYEIEYPLRRHDGVFRWHLGRALPVRDSSGRVVRWFGTNTDIHDQKSAEIALRESEARFRNVADNAPVAIWVTRADGQCEYLNKPWFDFTGQSEEAAMGFGWLDVVHPEDRERSARIFSDANEHSQPFRLEYRLLRKDGQYRWCVDSAVPRRGPNGEHLGYVGSVIDITDRAVAEQERAALLEKERAARAEAERASEAKSEFLATLSHELRTPLTPVLLTASLLEEHPLLPEELRADVQTIRRNVELEAQLIGDLLDLTRIARGKLQLEWADVELNGVVKAAVDVCRAEASAQLDVYLDARRAVVRGDAVRLQQVIWNLVNNAVKFTPAGGRITVRTQDFGEDRVRVVVEDTGAGIDPQTLPRLFDAFEQGDARAGRQQAGLGLGLAISRALARAQGGDVLGESAGRGRGATFTVDLPASEPSGSAGQATPTVEPARESRPRSILLVEDHAATLSILRKLLVRLGHDVQGASSVADAITAGRAGHFDVLISDIGLPDGSGLDVIAALKDRFDGRAIALTGYGMDSDVAATRNAGFAEHLIKPVDLAQLQAAIDRVGA